MADTTLPLPISFHNGEEPLTVEIPLTRGYKTIVDAIDADLLAVRWFPANKNGRIYVWRKTLNCPMSEKKTIHLHRVIFSRMIGRELFPAEIVDHKDNNPLNNQRTNLRLANKIRNAQNAKKASRNTSGYKGVWFHKQCGKWAADIKVNKKKCHIGLFDTAEAAYEAYCAAAKHYFGEFARFE